MDAYIRHAQLATLHAPITEESLVNDVLEGPGLDSINVIEALNAPILFNGLYAILLSDKS